MSSLSERHKEIIEELFNLQNGVLNFSNSSFKNFMLSKTKIDVYEAPGYIEEPSKAKKFRYFIAHEPDMLVGKVLLELLDKRDGNIERDCMRMHSDYQDPYEQYSDEIKNIAKAMCNGTVLPATNQERLNITLRLAEGVLKDLISVSEKVCNNQMYNYTQSENSFNDYYRDVLGEMGYSQIRDQTRHGISTKGCDAGEVDLLLMKENKEEAIVEALKLDSVNKSYIKEHIDKAILNYNSLGTPTFIMAYVRTEDFGKFWGKYYNHLKGYNYKLEIRQGLAELPRPNAAVRCARLILARDEYDFPVYFLAINVK